MTFLDNIQQHKWGTDVMGWNFLCDMSKDIGLLGSITHI